MRETIIDLLDKIDATLANAHGVIAESDLRAIALLRNEIRTRLDHPEEVVVAGLVGGTGSGKSSLLNEVAGAEVADTGGIRPTTEQPLAMVPVQHARAFAGYLDEIGVTQRVEWEEPSWLCLIDTPDTDSVNTGHLRTVAELMPRLDVVIWVVDPVKYRDAALHQHVRDLVSYESQHLFVLNQVDRLSPGERQLIVDDLVKALGEDGVDGPEVVVTAAAPVAGPAEGVDEMVEAVRRRHVAGSAVYGKLIADVAAATRDLSRLTSGGSSLDFEARWSEMLPVCRAYLETGQASDAARRVASLLESLAEESGDESAIGLLGLAKEVHEVISGGGSVTTMVDGVRTRIEQPARQILQRRAQAQAAVADLALSVERLGGQST